MYSIDYKKEESRSWPSIFVFYYMASWGWVG